MAKPAHADLHRLLAGDDPRPAAACARAALTALQPLYLAGLRGHQLLQRAQRRHAGRPTVSIGNLTTGGTGKTPMTVHVVHALLAHGHRPAVLTRGHGAPTGQPDATTDEVAVLQSALPAGVPVVANPSRSDGAADLLHRQPGVTCLVLDDGFQHRRLGRDLDLVLIDATNPFGFGHLLPRGLLREPVSALRRADAVIVTRADTLDDAGRAALVAGVTKHHGRPPMAFCRHAWSAVVLDDATHPVAALQGRRVFACAGVGNAAAFFRQVEAHTDAVAGARAFDDHHADTADDLAALVLEAQRADADLLITTEKDYVKWRPLLDATPSALPIARPVLTLRFLAGEAELDALLRDRLPVVVEGG